MKNSIRVMLVIVVLHALFPWNYISAEELEEEEKFDYRKDIEYDLFLRPQYEFKTGYHIVGEWYHALGAKRMIGSFGVRLNREYIDCVATLGMGNLNEDDKSGFVGRLGFEGLLGSKTNNIFSRTQLLFGEENFWEQRLLLTRGMGSFLYSAVGIDFEKVFGNDLLYSPLFFGGIRIRDFFRLQGGAAYEEERFYGRVEILLQYSFGEKKAETPE